MTLRRVGPEDWAAFRDIRLEMLSLDPPAFGTPRHVWAAKPEAEIRAWLTALHAVGLFEGARILGTAAFDRQKGERAAHRATVIAVYLRPEARGLGRMARILDRLARDAREIGILQLELQVVTSNTAAIAAYARAGYQTIGTFPRTMRVAGRFIDEDVMVKALEG